MTGRKPFTPTDDQRRMVRALSGFGVPHDDIGRIVKCSPPTLRRRFRDELDLGTAEANAKVAQTLYQQATTPGNIAATIFWLKARAGWREKQVVELAGNDGAAAPLYTVMVTGLSDRPSASDEPRHIENHTGTGRERTIFPPYKHESRW
jgi:hypothetical protein